MKILSRLDYVVKLGLGIETFYFLFLKQKNVLRAEKTALNLDHSCCSSQTETNASSLVGCLDYLTKTAAINSLVKITTYKNTQTEQHLVKR